MKQCLLIISIILTCFLSFADETTSYSPRDYSTIATQADTVKHRIYVRDHLGSTRAVIDEAGELLQTVNSVITKFPYGYLYKK